MFRITKIVPLFNQVITTTNMYGDNVMIGGLIDSTRTNTIKDYQTVLAVGPMVKTKGNIKPGDIVFINPSRYGIMKHEFSLRSEENVEKDNMHMNFRIPTFKLYDKKTGKSSEVMVITDNDLYFVAEGDEIPDSPVDNPVTVPDKKVII